MDEKNDSKQGQNEALSQTVDNSNSKFEATPVTGSSEPVETDDLSDEKVSSQREESTSEEKSEEIFCSNCGKKLEGAEAFCSSCGTQRNTVTGPSSRSSNVTTPIASASHSTPKAEKKKTKSKAPFIGIASVVVIVIVLAVVFLMPGKKQVDFQKVYDDYCKSTWAKVGQDGSYLSIDTNPYDKDDGDYRYLFEANKAVEEVNTALGFNESVYDDMQGTTALMGKQTDTNEDGTISISWTYHPDRGLEVTYKKAKQ